MREPAAQIARQIEATRCLRQQPKPVPPAYHRDRGFGGAEHPYGLRRRSCTGKTSREAFGRWTIGPGDDEAREPPEWRIAGALARLDLGRVESVAIAGNDRAHYRVVRLMGLEIALAAARLAAGAAGDLVQELKGPLSGARVAIVQAEIGIDDADQIEPREMVSLRHQLGADDDIHAAFGDFLEFLAHVLRGGHQVARQH